MLFFSWSFLFYNCRRYLFNYLKSNQSINIGNIRSNMINSNEMTKAIKNRLITLGKSPNTNEIEQWKNYLRNNPNSNLTNVGLKTSK